MGKATRWIRGLFGGKKGKENVQSKPNSAESEKKRRSFTKPMKDNSFNQIPANIPVANDAAWLRSYIAASEEENNHHHAMAVAAATAAAADAAVKAAQAAEAVLRLTSHGRERLLAGATEKTAAAVKIQTTFRGYLARKALRALKCLVKLQALVRGYIVRKRAAATLHSMQALFRAQAAARSQRARHSIHEIRARKSIESFERDIHRKRLSASYEPHYYMFEESPKIVEMDTCNGLRPRRISTHSTNEYCMMPSSPLLTGPNPNRIKIPDYSQDWGYIEEDYKCVTTQSTPRFAFAGRGNVVPITMARSVNGDHPYDCTSCCPNYMTNTQSFKAKSRSYSAPKQRPEPFVSKKRLPLNEIMASRSSFSGVRMQQQQRQVHEEFEY